MVSFAAADIPPGPYIMTWGFWVFAFLAFFVCYFIIYLKYANKFEEKGEEHPNRHALLIAAASFFVIVFVFNYIGNIYIEKTSHPSFDDNNVEFLLNKAIQSPGAVYTSASKYYSDELGFGEGQVYPISIFSRAYPSTLLYESDLCSLENDSVCEIIGPIGNQTFKIKENFIALLSVCCTARTNGTCKIGIGEIVSCS